MCSIGNSSETLTWWLKENRGSLRGQFCCKVLSLTCRFSKCSGLNKATGNRRGRSLCGMNLWARVSRGFWRGSWGILRGFPTSNRARWSGWCSQTATESSLAWRGTSNFKPTTIYRKFCSKTTLSLTFRQVKYLTSCFLTNSLRLSQTLSYFTN